MNKKQELVEKKMQELEIVGTYDPFLDKLAKTELNKVLTGLETEDNTDIPVKVRGKEYVIQIEYWDNEVSFHPITQEQYDEMFF